MYMQVRINYAGNLDFLKIFHLLNMLHLTDREVVKNGRDPPPPNIKSLKTVV